MLAGLMDGMLAGLGELVHEGREAPIMVWRVENARGVGPYISDKTTDRFSPDAPDKRLNERALFRFVVSGDKYNTTDPILRRDVRESVKSIVDAVLHPTPPEDFETREWNALPSSTRKQFKFGFPTKRSVIDWFGAKRVGEFEEQGYTIKQVPAGRTILSKSGRQVLYVPWGKRYSPPPKDFYQRYVAEMESRRQGRSRRR